MAGEAVVDGLGGVTTKNWMSLRVKGVDTVSVLPAQYLPGRRRKNNVIQARSELYWSWEEPHWATDSMQ